VSLEGVREPIGNADGECLVIAEEL